MSLWNIEVLTHLKIVHSFVIFAKFNKLKQLHGAHLWPSRSRSVLVNVSVLSSSFMRAKRGCKPNLLKLEQSLNKPKGCQPKKKIT